MATMTYDELGSSDTFCGDEVLERITELEEEPEESRSEEQKGELESLRELNDELASVGAGDSSGVLCIADNAFERHAQEAAESVHGSLEGWPYTCIDWEKAASELQQDYTQVDVDGKTFWARS